MKIIKLLIFILLPLTTFGQSLVKGYVYGKEKEPLIGAVVCWQNEDKGVLTDANGYFFLEGNPLENHMLIVSYVGFQEIIEHVKDYAIELHIQLTENASLEDVLITKKRQGTIKSQISILQTEKITTKELRRAACCNLSESFETNPSVDVSFSDAVTGAKQIQLLGLAGTYVQMLTENYPNFRGAASVYGLDYIPGPWLESIQVSKGAASVKNGYESLTGQMNIEYKKPRLADPLSLNIFTSDAGRYEGSADAAFVLNEKLATGLFLHYSNESLAHDNNGDTFLDMPIKHQFNVMNRWSYMAGKYGFENGIRFMQDNRISGQTTHTLQDKSLPPYKIGIDVNRYEFFTKNHYLLDEERNGNIALIFTGSIHDQQSKYATREYAVYQNNIYASLMYETELSKIHLLSMGLSTNWDKYKHTTNILNLPTQPTQETVSGAYTQYTFNKDNKFVALLGLRADYSSIYKFFVTPRVHLKYTPNAWVNLRVSVGKGYRSVFVLPENSYYLASNRKIELEHDLRQESAWNYGTSLSFIIPIQGKDLSFSGEWYYTDFQQQVVTDVDNDAHAVQFYNLRGKSYANSVQLEASYPFFEGFSLLAAYRWIHAKTEYAGKLMQKPLVSDYKALATASYETAMRKWQFDLTAQFNGGGRMPLSDATTPLWGDKFDSFTLLNAQVTKNFKLWSIYIGAENITNFSQKNPIIDPTNPFGSNFDATMVWGPTQGRKFYMGMRFALGK